MKFVISREALLRPLNLVAGVVEKRQTLPILANVLVSLEKGRLSLTGTDLEVELVGRVPVDKATESGEITVPARKLVDICKSLPEQSELQFSLESQKLQVRSGRSRFLLSTLPASEFPSFEQGQTKLEFDISQGDLKSLIDRTAFAMAQQDVRYYLNGMLWELKQGKFKVVATDGHRLALCGFGSVNVSGEKQAILPRKAVLELARLLSDDEATMHISIGDNNMQATTGDFTFSSKLVDGKFPDYEKVLPRAAEKELVADREGFRQALSRAAILSNEKYRGIRLHLGDSELKIIANNPEQEEAEETLAVDYSSGDLEIGFNVGYLLDVASVIKGNKIKVSLSDSNSSALLEDYDSDKALYVVMPMRL
jgi:DNA polymerase III subunit beta